MSHNPSIITVSYRRLAELERKARVLDAFAEYLASEVRHATGARARDLTAVQQNLKYLMEHPDD